VAFLFTEPGFYFGAMFVSYALTVALFVFVGLTLYFLFSPSDTVYIISITVATILFTPFPFAIPGVFLYCLGGITINRKGSRKERKVLLLLPFANFAFSFARFA